MAGLSSRVDHRSLAEQSATAEKRGELARAVELSREPTQHQGKAGTAALRRGHVLDRVRVNQNITHTNQQAVADFLRRAEQEGRLQAAPPGQHEQAKKDRARETPNGPPAPVEVGGYTQVRNGKPVKIAGYTQERPTSTKTSTGPTPRGCAPRGPSPTRQGVSPAPMPSRGGSGGAAGSAPGGGVGKSKEQRAEERRAREAGALAEQQAQHIEQLARAYVADLIRLSEKLQRAGAASPVLASLTTLATQDPAALRWLERRHEVAQEQAEAVTEHRRLTTKREQARAKVLRRQKRLDKHERTEQPGRLHWKSKRAWAERRENLTGSLDRAERSYKRAQRKSDPNALAILDERADVLGGALEQMERERRERWPLSCDRDLPALDQPARKQKQAPEAAPPTTQKRPPLRTLGDATRRKTEQQPEWPRPRPPWARR